MVLSEKVAQFLTTSDIQRGRNGERSAVAHLSLESRKVRVRENGDHTEHHPPCHDRYVLDAVRHVGRRDPKAEKGVDAKSALSAKHTASRKAGFARAESK
jgi:hypothetical protein